MYSQLLWNMKRFFLLLRSFYLPTVARSFRDFSNFHRFIQRFQRSPIFRDFNNAFLGEKVGEHLRNTEVGRDRKKSDRNRIADSPTLGIPRVIVAPVPSRGKKGKKANGRPEICGVACRTRESEHRWQWPDEAASRERGRELDENASRAYKHAWHNRWGMRVSEGHRSSSLRFFVPPARNARTRKMARDRWMKKKKRKMGMKISVELPSFDSTLLRNEKIDRRREPPTVPSVTVSGYLRTIHYREFFHDHWIVYYRWLSCDRGSLCTASPLLIASLYE